jgi:hypothetical protein
MKSLRVLPMALVLGLLVGCATQPKPEMTDEQYSSSAFGWHTVSQCGRSGAMDLETASLGKAYIQSKLGNYQVDLSRFNQEVTRLYNTGSRPTKEDCNTMAMDILDTKRSIAINNQSVEADQRVNQELINSTRIKNTYCNRIGNSTFCNTY